MELSVNLTTTTALGPVQRAHALERLADRLVDGVLTIATSEHRSQLRNREAARERLADILAAADPSRPRGRGTPVGGQEKACADEEAPSRRRGRLRWEEDGP